MSGRDPSTAAGPRVLPPRARRVLRAAMAALVHTPERPAPEHVLSWWVEDYDHYVACSPITTRLAVRALCLLLALSPLFVLRRLRRFTALPVADRMRCLQGLEHSPLRPVALLLCGVKVTLCMIWFEHPDVLPELGYPGHRKLGGESLP